MTEQTVKNQPNRIYFIDYMRAFLIVLMVLDHSLNAYCTYYTLWFLPDFDTSLVMDALHLYNDSFMMPALFFLAGFFVFPSLLRRGYVSFLKERFLRLVLPFCVGIPLVCPLLTYPRYVRSAGVDAVSLWQFMTDTFYDKPQAGPFWFLYYLAALTAIVVIVYACCPPMIRALGRLVTWGVRRPFVSGGLLFVMGAALMGVSDLIWGAPWWIGGYDFFYVRGSRFLMKALLFLMGAGFGFAGLHRKDDLWAGLSRHCGPLVMTAAAVLTLYVTFTLSYFHDGAYDNTMHTYVRLGGSFAPSFWPRIWSFITDYSLFVLVRTTLLTACLFLQLVATLAVFHRFFNKPMETFMSLSACSFGIYLIHEPFVVWGQWFFLGSDIPPVIKFAVVGGGSLFAAWMLTKHVLLKTPGIRRIVGQ